MKTHHFRLAKQTLVRKFDILMFDKCPKNAEPKFGMQNLTIIMVVRYKPLTKDHLPLKTAFSGPKGWPLVTDFTAIKF